MKFSLWPFPRRRRGQSEKVLVRARFIRTDRFSGGELRLSSPLCRLGRVPDNDLRFDNDSVSGHHAEVHHLPDGTFQIRDLDSTNGTWVNGQRVHAHPLRNGDVVELGEVRLHFRTGDT